MLSNAELKGQHTHARARKSLFCYAIRAPVDYAKLSIKDSGRGDSANGLRGYRNETNEKKNGEKKKRRAIRQIDFCTLIESTILAHYSKYQ